MDLIFSVFFTYIFITLNRGGHMEKKPPLVMTPFDESLTNDFLQLVKIILPYLPDHVQRIAGIYETYGTYECLLLFPTSLLS